MKMVIPIAFCFDNNYVIPAAVAFYSLLENANKNYEYKLYVLHENITSKNQELLKETIKKFYNASIEFKNMKNKFVEEWAETKIKGHYSKECLYKLVLSEIFPEFDKIILSDVDVVFKKDISPSFYMLDEDNYIAGVSGVGKLASFFENIPKELKTLFGENRLIGAGYLIYNLKKIREDNLQQKLLDNYEKYKKIITQPEQDILNIVFKDKISYLPLSYCFCTYMYNLYRKKYKADISIDKHFFNYIFGLYKKNLKYDSVYSEIELNDAFRNPIIIHYATEIKPWNKRFTRRKLDWLLYLIKTPFCKKYFIKDFN